ncbi:MAG: SIMPL domain-containing protein, partial [Hydrogenovibrio crunogenus]|nr:SIMPL domain-containing protein [Hydrogenovibrio crunogenus]
VYDDHQQIQHWKGQQTLNLTLKNQPGLADILSQLQPYLNYNDMQFSVSEAQREQTMTSLLTSALAQYQTKAKLIADAFDQSSYRITQTHIQQPNPPQPFRVTANAYAAKMSSTDVSPAIKTGASRLSITVSGRVLISNLKN